LWCHFFELKKTGKAAVVGSISFMVLQSMKSEYIDLALPDNTTGWKQGWFYLDNPAPALKTRTGRAPVPYPEWTNQLASRDNEELQPLMDDLEQIKWRGSPVPRWPLASAAASSSLSRIGPTQPSNTGAVRPHSGRAAQGLQGEDDGPCEGHLWWADPQPGVPQGTSDIQSLRPGVSSTLMCSQVRSSKIYIFYLVLIELSYLVFASPRGHLLVFGATARRGSVQLQGP
jgi:hypothetical protein